MGVLAGQTEQPPAASTRADDEAALWAAFKTQGSMTAREGLFSMHAAFARNIARRHFREHRGGDLEVQDLYQHAYTGLLEALDRFDPDYGAPFRSYAARRISGSVLDGIARMSEVREQLLWRHHMRHERLRSLADAGVEKADAAPIEKLTELAVGLALGFMLEGTGLYSSTDEDGMQGGPETAYDSLQWKETVVELHEQLAALPEREQTILRQHYVNGVGFDQLATLLKVTKGRISQLHRGALLLLRKRMRERTHTGKMR